jgi:hypothetical protein
MYASLAGRIAGMTETATDDALEFSAGLQDQPDTHYLPLPGGRFLEKHN